MPAPIHGRLAAVDLAASTLTTIYAVPSARKATVGFSVCNRNDTGVTIRWAHIDAATVGSVANEDYKLYGATVGANGSLDVAGLPMTQSHCIGVWSSAAGVNVVVEGREEDA